MPTPAISALRAPASSSTSPTSRVAQRDRLRGGQVGVERLVALREHAVGEVGERDAQVALAEVQPERDARRAVERDEHGRAADAPGPRGAASPGGSTTSRSSCSSAMTADTVEGASAVRRASSAREVGPVDGEHAEHAGARGEPVVGLACRSRILPGFASDVRTRRWNRP